VSIPVCVDGAAKIYATPGQPPVTGLDEASLSIHAGEMVALVGPSGCGKTTLLSLVGCIDRPTRGAVTIEGNPTAGLNDDALTALRRHRIGTVFQSFNLLPTLTVRENVSVPLVLQKRGYMETNARVSAILDGVGLRDKSLAFPAQLSGGEAQRVAIARAIVHEPAVVLADEPTGNLDSRSGGDVLRLLRDLASRGQAILIATHSIEATSACDRVIRMQDGRIVG
jgi:ABC-type lipoprotein export system ATPase subunit